MMPYASRCASKLDARNNPVQPSWTAKASRPPRPKGNVAKKVKGRKRHILVDVMGLLLCVLVHKGNTQERAGAKRLLQRVKEKGFARLQLICADGGYDGQPMRDWVFELAIRSRQTLG